MKTLVEIHVLQNFAPSNLNRDDTGAPKDAFFGGFRRARISSQCLKSTVRKYFSAEKLFNEGELAIRTKRILGKIVELLVKKDRDADEARVKAVTAINSLGFKFKDNEKTEYLLFLGETEITNLVDLIHEKWDEIGNPAVRLEAIKKIIQDKLYPESPDMGKMNAIYRALDIDGESDKIAEEKITAIENNLEGISKLLQNDLSKIEPFSGYGSAKRTRKKKSELADWEKELSDLLKEGKKELSVMGKVLQKIMDGGKAVDLALFGRMLADMPEKNQNASCQVAHAISTHAVNREFDFYTAIDELKPDDTAGSDMMGDIEFTSACFYRYAVVDYQKLAENLQSDEELARKGLAAFLMGFTVAEPTGHQNSFAAHNAPEFLSISVRHGTAPRNLSNAYETPVSATKEESITKKSATKLAEKAAALDTLYKTKPNSRYACSKDTFGDNFSVEGLGEKLPSIPEIIDWAIKELEKKGE